MSCLKWCHLSQGLVVRHVDEEVTLPDLLISEETPSYIKVSKPKSPDVFGKWILRQLKRSWSNCDANVAENMQTHRFEPKTFLLSDYGDNYCTTLLPFITFLASWSQTADINVQTPPELNEAFKKTHRHKLRVFLKPPGCTTLTRPVRVSQVKSVLGLLQHSTLGRLQRVWVNKQCNTIQEMLWSTLVTQFNAGDCECFIYF